MYWVAYVVPGFSVKLDQFHPGRLKSPPIMSDFGRLDDRSSSDFLRWDVKVLSATFGR